MPRPPRLVVLPLLLALAAFPVASAGFVPFPKADGIDVADLAADPFAYKGDLTVRGAVMNVNPGKKLFEVIDYREYRACRTVDCAKDWITIIYDGTLPGRTKVVEATGTVERNPAGKGGFVLRANSVKIK